MEFQVLKYAQRNYVTQFVIDNKNKKKNEDDLKCGLLRIISRYLNTLASMRFTRVNSGQFSAVHYTNKLLNANCPFGVGVLRLYFGKSFTGEASLIERTEFSFLHVPQYILKWRILDEASWQKCFLSHTTLPCVGDNTSFSR